MDTKEDALSILPSAFRSQAKIVRLDKFTMEEVEEILRQHRNDHGIDIGE